MASLFDLGGVISGIIHEHNLDKYARLILAMAVAAFVAYYATYGATAAALAQSGRDLLLAGFLARAAAVSAMSLAVWRTWTKNAPKGTVLVDPPGLEESKR